MHCTHRGRRGHGAGPLHALEPAARRGVRRLARGADVAPRREADGAAAQDRAAVLEAVTRDGSALQFAPHALRADADVVTKSVTAPAGDGRAGDALSYADEELRANATIVLAAVKVAPQALQHAAPELLRDRSFAEKAIKISWKSLAFVSKDLRADKKLLEAARAAGLAGRP